MAGNTLYLIDGHAQIFRAYHAIRGGMNSPVTGEPTHAVFGFAGMLLKLFQRYDPAYVAMAVDSEGPTFREAIAPDYKSNREAPPEDLPPQIERIRELARLFGIPVLEQPEAEADDVIATLVEKLASAHPDLAIRILSKDKDLQQLLGPRVELFDIYNETPFTQADLESTYGIRPDQVGDALALSGDAIDNVAGVQGIGQKTAAKLIREHGDLDTLLANTDALKPKQREKIEQAAEQLRTSRQLVRLKDDLDLELDLDDARCGGIDAEGLRHLFRELGFRRHLRDLDEMLASGAAPSPATDAGGQGRLFATESAGDASEASRVETRTEPARYEAVTTDAQLEALVERLAGAGAFALDAETIGLSHRAEICGLSFACEPGHGWYVPLRSPEPARHLAPERVLRALAPVLGDPGVAKVGHNLKYDILVLRRAGVAVRGVGFDTMVGAHLAGHPGRRMDDLALALLKHESTPIASLIGGGRDGPQRTMDRVPLETITPYAAEDADVPLRLRERLEAELAEMGLAGLARSVEMPLVEILAEMEHNGIRVDPEILGEQQRELNARIDELKEQIQQRAGASFNVDSPKQLARVLFEELGFPVKRRTKTGPSTDSEVLEKLAELEPAEGGEAKWAIPRLVLEHRQLAKLVGTYLEALRQSRDAETGRVHATFSQTSTATGRLSSSDPNLQNIPIRTELGRRVRKAFVAEPGHRLVSADYSQIELRVLAHLSEDPGLIGVFERDEDIHAAVAAEVFGVAPESVTSAQRGHAKTINFGIVYGVTPYGLARRIEGVGVEEAKALIERYKERFPGIDRFLGACVEKALSDGYVTTILGRRRAIDEIHATNPNTRSLGERLAINSVVQGSAADLIKTAMVRLHERMRAEAVPARMLLQIHDELVLESPSDDAPSVAEIVRAEMESAMSLAVPLKAETGMGTDWFEMK